MTKKQEARIETAEIKFMRSIAGDTGKDQIRNTKIGEYLKIFNLNNKQNYWGFGLYTSSGF
jgi:hypothetical protein